jgi:hypothetical protein
MIPGVRMRCLGAPIDVQKDAAFLRNHFGTPEFRVLSAQRRNQIVVTGSSLRCRALAA